MAGKWTILPGVLPLQVICCVFESWHFVLLQHTEINWLDISYSSKHGYPGDKHWGKFAVEDKKRNLRNNNIEISLTDISQNESDVVYMINKQILSK